MIKLQTKVKVLCFAGLGEAIGKCVEIPVDSEISVSELRERLISTYPEHERSIRSCMIAVNHEYVTQETAIKTGDQIALIPPVSGG
ncbi:molybdopterin converting factor subunit 1 [Lihuaxuella thermophila]|uniref:Molybdopterin synthase sulfur carrier subunit n=1 Tax=Lihuaxuella thermophila TaxID=1173111 RepID=A0A1H8AAE1_9BACL|nr:molybdopterin converting factor subunit 1 [Lihuaxuella thermophila]SEM67680.1 molybdopterin synthase catalytic subunit/molybdopterin synthase sulfur carrier subunit [Lihuaxuella thermophila]